MKASLITLLAAALLGAGTAPAQNEYAEIARLRGMNQTVRGIRSMADGEHYTTLEGSNIIRHKMCIRDRINTVVSLYYYLLVVKAMYITPNDAPVAPFRSDRYTRISLALCMAGVLLLGVVSAVYDGINAFAFGL